MQEIHWHLPRIWRLDLSIQPSITAVPREPDAINAIEEYLQDVNEDKFKATRLLQDGTIRQIEIIGEAIRHISKDIRKTYPEIPWQDMAGMRDKLIHDYFGVDIEKVWDTAQEDLPVLKEQMIGILRDFGQE